MNEAKKWRLTSVVHVCAKLNAIFREIFDESAYARFLSRHGIASSKDAYAEFLREQEILKARRPKCC